MKTNLREIALGMGITSLVLCLGCQGDQASANGPLIATAAPAYALAPAETEATPAPPPAAKPGDATVPAVKQDSAPEPAAPPGSIIITKATLTNAVPGTNVAIAPPAGPPTLSPALAEVVRLIEANVGQDVLMAYITNSTLPFHVGANEIVYLHDLGVPPPIITTLINVDSSPEMAARKQAAVAVKPLPPGVALNEPATNLFIPKGEPFAVANPPEPMPVYPPTEASVAYTPAPNGEVPYDIAPPPTEVNYSYFYGSLAPYGTWCDVPGYGSCWRPTCATWNPSWRPYGDGGRWLWSNCGWYWYSDYSWGWAPFHYGRWCRPAGYGWCWVPDTCWGPSWVSWRYSPSYCGWAPLPPSACYTTGVGFSYYSGSVGIGFEFGLGAADYCYVPTARFCDRRCYDYHVPYHQNHTVHKDTVVVNNYIIGNNNTIVNNGVGFDRIAKVTRGDIRQVALHDTSSMKNLGTRHDRLESDGKTLTVYRPPTATLAHKSIVPAARYPGSSTAIPASYNKPGSVAYVGKNSFSEPAATRSPSPQSSPQSIYIGNNAGGSRTTPTPVPVYTRPLDAGRQPVIVTGGTPQPTPYTKPAISSAAAQSTEVGEARPSEPSHVARPGASTHATQHGSASAPKETQQLNPGYTRPAPGEGAPSKVASTPGVKAPGLNSSQGNAPGPKGGQARIEPGSDYQKPVGPQAPVARSPEQGYSRPAAAAPPSQNYNHPAQGGYNTPARIETHQSHVAPSSAPSSSPHVSAPSGGSSSGSSGGGSSGGGSSGKSSGSGNSSSGGQGSQGQGSQGQGSQGQGKSGR